MLNLRSQLRRNLFGYYFTNPHAEHYLRELAEILQTDPANLSREMKRLCDEGIFVAEPRGNQKHFRLNHQHPLYRELKSIAAKTVGVIGQLRQMVSNIPGVQQAYLYGSFARGNADRLSDIDVLIIGDPDPDKLATEAVELQHRLSREINYTVMSPRELRQRRRQKDAFIADVWSHKRVDLVNA